MAAKRRKLYKIALNKQSQVTACMLLLCPTSGKFDAQPGRRFYGVFKEKPKHKYIVCLTQKQDLK